MLLNSIVIPTYGRFKESLFSMITELCNLGFQVVLVDDNPVESKIKEELRLKYELIKSERFIYLDLMGNFGACTARNKGAEIADGLLVTFMDDDDYFITENFLKKINACVELIDQFDIFASNMVVEWKDCYYLPKFADFVGINAKEFLLEGNCFTPMLTVNRSYFLKVGGFDVVKKYQDHVFMIKCFLNGVRIYSFPLRTFVHVDHDNERITNSAAPSMNMRISYEDRLFKLFADDDSQFIDSYEKQRYMRIISSKLFGLNKLNSVLYVFSVIFHKSRPVSYPAVVKLLLNRLLFGRYLKFIKYNFFVSKLAGGLHNA